MGYTSVFGGELLFPSQLSYLSLMFSQDITLDWPTEQQVGGSNVVSDFMDLDATDVSLNVDMPSASATGMGNKATFNNIGSNTFVVRDNDGGSIQSVAPGEQWVVVLTDNTTVAGTWSTFQLGASVSVASASALAGAGIKAVSTTLNQKIDSDVEAATPFSAIDGDRAKCLIYTGGAGTCNLPTPGTVGNDWWFMLRNSGSGTLNVVPPSGVIDGSASINLEPRVSTFIFTDGTDFFTVGLSTGSVIGFDFVSVAIPGSGDFTLSGANLDRISYRFTGALTGNRTVIVPPTTQQYWVDNQTTGAFTLEIATAGQGSPPQVEQGDRAILYCDSVDVVNAVTTAIVSFPILITQGGTSATTEADARTNLQVAFSGQLMNAGAGLTGGGDLSADRTFQIDGTDDRNVDHTAVSVLAGVGLSGGGTIDADRTITLDLNDLGTEVSIATADFLAMVDDTDSGSGKVTVTNLGTAIAPVVDHDNLQNFVADAHVLHAGVTLTAGLGLTGGGDITTSRSFAVGSGEGIQANANDVALDIDALSEDSAIASGDFLAYWDTVAGNNKKVDLDDLIAAVSGVFTSSAITLSATATQDVAHSLGGIPDIVHVVLECTSAINGYGVGDEIVLDIGQTTADVTNVGAAAWMDVTNVGYRVFGGVGTIANRSSAAGFIPTGTNFDIKVRAVKF